MGLFNIVLTSIYTLIVIHKCVQARHSGWDAGIQSHGCETVDQHFASIKPEKFAKLPSMALDPGIPAGMTTFFGSTELMYSDEVYTGNEGFVFVDRLSNRRIVTNRTKY